MNITLFKILAGTVICLLGYQCLKDGIGRFLTLFVLFVLALIYIVVTKYLGVRLNFYYLLF
jgi:hypothetical protein